MVPRRGAARGRTGALHASGLRRSVGLCRGTACGCARGVGCGCAAAQCGRSVISGVACGCARGAVRGCVRGAAWDRAWASRGAPLKRSAELRLSAPCRCVSGQHAVALGRIVEPGRGAARNCSWARRQAVQGCSLGPRVGARQDCVLAQDGAAEGAAWSCAGAKRLRKGAHCVAEPGAQIRAALAPRKRPRGSATCGRDGALRGTAQGCYAGLYRSAACGCAKAAVWGSAGA